MKSYRFHLLLPLMWKVMLLCSSNKALWIGIQKSYLCLQISIKKQWTMISLIAGSCQKTDNALQQVLSSCEVKSQCPNFTFCPVYGQLFQKQCSEYNNNIIVGVSYLSVSICLVQKQCYVVCNFCNLCFYQETA